MPRTKSAKQRSLKDMVNHVDRIERSMLKRDPRHEWLKSNNMKQYCVTLTDTVILDQVQVGGASTFTGKIILNANALSYSLTGATGATLPQSAIWDEYAQLYEFYMAERLELRFIPTILRVETTTTGTQDTAILATASGHLPDSSNSVFTFFNPATNYVTAQRQASNILARKSGQLHCGQSIVSVKSSVDNTLLLKQSAPMLRTNGASGSREQYADETGCCIILPCRPPTDRVPFGHIQYSITYRFAGRNQPGVAKPSPQDKFSVDQLKDMLSQAMLDETQEKIGAMSLCDKTQQNTPL